MNTVESTNELPLCVCVCVCLCVRVRECARVCVRVEGIDWVEVRLYIL